MLAIVLQKKSLHYEYYERLRTVLFTSEIYIELPRNFLIELL